MRGVLPERAGEGPDIDAGMVFVALVFVSLEQGEEFGIDFVGLGRQTPAAVRRGEGAQQNAVAVEGEGRGGLQGGEVGRTHAALEFVEAPGDGEAEHEDGCCCFEVARVARRTAVDRPRPSRRLLRSLLRVRATGWFHHAAYE